MTNCIEIERELVLDNYDLLPDSIKAVYVDNLINSSCLRNPKDQQIIVETIRKDFGLIKHFTNLCDFTEENIVEIFKEVIAKNMPITFFKLPKTFGTILGEYFKSIDPSHLCYHKKFYEQELAHIPMVYKADQDFTHYGFDKYGISNGLLLKNNNTIYFEKNIRLSMADDLHNAALNKFVKNFIECEYQCQVYSVYGDVEEGVAMSGSQFLEFKSYSQNIDNWQECCMFMNCHGHLAISKKTEKASLMHYEQEVSNAINTDYMLIELRYLNFNLSSKNVEDLFEITYEYKFSKKLVITDNKNLSFGFEMHSSSGFMLAIKKINAHHNLS